MSAPNRVMKAKLKRMRERGGITAHRQRFTFDHRAKDGGVGAITYTQGNARYAAPWQGSPILSAASSHRVAAAQGEVALRQHDFDAAVAQLRREGPTAMPVVTQARLRLENARAELAVASGHYCDACDQLRPCIIDRCIAELKAAQYRADDKAGLLNLDRARNLGRV